MEPSGNRGRILGRGTAGLARKFLHHDEWLFSRFRLAWRLFRGDAP